MATILQLLNQYPEHVYLAFFGLMLVTSWGVFPGNTDIFMLTMGSLTASSDLKFVNILLISWTAIFIGESTAFLWGRKLGLKIFQINFFQKEKYQRRIKIMEDYLDQGKIKTVLFLRFVPILRPINIALVSTLTRHLYQVYLMHVTLMLIYISLNLTLAYKFSSTVQNWLK